MKEFTVTITQYHVEDETPDDTGFRPLFWEVRSLATGNIVANGVYEPFLGGWATTPEDVSSVLPHRLVAFLGDSGCLS